MKNWTGEEIIEMGKYQGDMWNSVHLNSLMFYIKNFKDGYMKTCAKLELERREALGKF